jgi:hypothetical protein
VRFRDLAPTLHPNRSNARLSPTLGTEVGDTDSEHSDSDCDSNDSASESQDNDVTIQQAGQAPARQYNREPGDRFVVSDAVDISSAVLRDLLSEEALVAPFSLQSEPARTVSTGVARKLEESDYQM